MSETVATLALACGLGVAAHSLLLWLMKGASWARIAILVLLPPAALFAVFFAFFEGAPAGEDWMWLTVGLGLFWPWYLAWCAGWASSALLRRAIARDG